MPDSISAYLAGPDVFAPDADDRFVMMRRLCIEKGITPICPTDGDLPPGLAGATLARHIKFANIQSIRRASCVVANISPFRGPNMDPGTAYEIGLAEALGKPVFLWSETPATLAERTPAALKDRDAQGWMIENFGLAENLMIGINDFGPVSTTFAAALANACRRFTGIYTA